VARGLGFAAALYGVSILLSRVIGLVREAVIGRTLGNGAEADVYWTAFVIPDFLNYLLAGGALSLVFIPLFHAHLARGDEPGGWRAFSSVANALALLLVTATVALFAAAPTLAPLVAPGMSAEQHARLAELIRILLPAQIFHVLGGLISATLQARERHVMPALAPLLYTGGIVVFGVVLGPTLGAEGFAWGVLAGSFAGPFLLPLIGGLRAGLRWSPTLDLRSPDLRTYFWRSLPVMLGFSVVVFDDFLLRYFGSLVEPGTISRLTYAKTLMRVPMGVFGLAAGMAAYPVLARLCAEGRNTLARDTLEGALRGTLVLAVVAQAALTVAGPQIALVIWGERRFSPAELAEIGAFTGWVSLGLWAWSTQGLIARGFYARGDTWSPTLVGSGVTLAFAPLYGLLGRAYGGTGLAVASSIAISANAVGLLFWLNRRLGRPTGPGVVAALVRLVPACGVGVAAGWGISSALAPVVGALPSVAAALVRGGVGGGVAAVVTLGLAAALGLAEVRVIAARVVSRLRKRRRPATGSPSS
jgi:putative peptidoglycan lipid II flippase